MRLHNWLFGRIYMNEETGESGGGGGGSDTSADTSSMPTGGGESSGSESSNDDVDAGAGAPAAKEPADPGAPKSMLEAIEKSLDKPDDKKPEAKEPGKVKPVAKGDDKAATQAEDDPLKMPEGLHVKAQERFRQMVSMVKEKDQRIQQLETSSQPAIKAATALGNFIKDTGATADQFSMMSQYLKAANSGDVETEYNILVGRLRELQMQTGRTFDNLPEQSDPLQQFPDLAAAVASYQITRQHAMELAKARGMQAQQEQVTQQQREHQAEAQQWVREKDQNINTIRDWERNMAASDPEYAQVSAVMKKNKEALEWVVRNTPPGQWQHQMTLLYNQTKAARKEWVAPAPAAPRPIAGSVGQPLGTGKAPSTMFQAMFPEG